MPILRMQAPEGLANFTHEGHPAEIDGDGVVQIDHRHVAAYEQHGFTMLGAPPRVPVAAAEPRPFAPQMREANSAVLALFDKLMKADESTLAKLSAVLNEEPEPLPPEVDPAAIHAADPRPVTEPGPIPSEGALTDEQIERMTPAQMKAWLKARDVPMVGVGSDADVLRAKVRATNAG